MVKIHGMAPNPALYCVESRQIGYRWDGEDRVYEFESVYVIWSG